MRANLSLILTIVLLFGISSSFILGCDKLRDNAVIGNWIAIDRMNDEGMIVRVAGGEEITISIGDDGFGNIRRGARKEDFRWVARFHKFTMRFHDKIVEKNYYSLKNDSLVWTFEDNDTYIFTRQKK